MGHTFSGTYSSGIYIFIPSFNPVSVTGVVQGTTYGLYASSDQAWQITNSGTVSASAGDGVELLGGGTVTNTYLGHGTIRGSENGILIAGGDGTVSNDWSITGGTSFGVDLQLGGYVANGGYGNITADSGVGVAVSGTVKNFGIITGNFGEGVELGGGGYVYNVAAIAGHNYGIVTAYANSTVTNFGSIDSPAGTGVKLYGGGTLTNEPPGSLTPSRISGYQYGIWAGGPATVQNDGTVVGLATVAGTAGVGVWLADGGTLGNGGPTDGGFIYGYGTGVLVSTATGRVINYNGSIVGEDGNGVELHKGGTVHNQSGTVWGFVEGVRVAGGGRVENYSGGQITGGGATAIGIDLVNGGTVLNSVTCTISGGRFGVAAETAAATVINYGIIATTGTGGFAVRLLHGGTVSNGPFGTITGDAGAVFLQGGGSVSNATTLIGSAPGVTTGGVGLVLASGGTFSNLAGGMVSAVAYGVVGSLAATIAVINAGSISAGFDAGVRLDGGGSVTNQAGGAIYGGSYAVVARNLPVRVNNAGSLDGGEGVRLFAGGTVTNGPATAAGNGQIVGRGFGAILDAYGVVSNSGTIAGGYEGVGGDGGGRLTNMAGGLIAGGRNGVSFAGAGTVTNAGTMRGGFTAGSTLGVGLAVDTSVAVNRPAGVIEGGRYGVQTQFVSSPVSNAGRIAGYTGGVDFRVGGTLTNTGSGGITGGRYGVVVQDYGGGSFAVGTITNQGSIHGDYAGIRFENQVGGTVVNAAVSTTGTGHISGSVAGVKFDSVAGTVVNAGTITATGKGVQLGAGGRVTNQAGGRISGSTDGVYIHGAGTVLNAGTIVAPGGGLAVKFSGGSGRVIAVPGAVFTGNVTADALFTNVLELSAAAGAGSLAGLGTKFANFRSLMVDANAKWSLGGGNSLAAGTPISLGAGATLTVAGKLQVAGSALLPAKGTLAVGAAGTVEIGTTGGAPAGRITVDATRTLTANGVLSGPVTDNGRIAVAAHGALTLAGPVGGSGTIGITQATVLSATGGVASGLAFLPGTGGATLDLAAPAQVSGLITGFGASPGERIDLLGKVVTGLVYTPTAATSGVLALTGPAGAIASLHFGGGSYTTSKFHFGADGRGGTNLTFG